MTHFLERDLTPSTPSRPAFTPTEEQTAILSAATETETNLLISALAGAAKTSTLVLIANEPSLASTGILCLAFNRKIADEMRGRLPSNCTSMTLNSLGHKAWSTAISRRCKVDTKKNYNLVKAYIDDQRKDVKDQLYDSFSDMLRTLAHAKSSGWVPERCQRPATSLFHSDDDFFSSLDERLSVHEEDLLVDCLCESIELAHQGEIDFDDQIYMSTCFPCKFPSYPLTMIDEAQDLSELNHAMLEQIVNGNRLIAVGDACQAIYAFRGAYADSMDRLQQRFSMIPLTLSISFRCPKAIIAEAQWRAPHMKPAEWAKEGEVVHLDEWTIENLPGDATILCRNNAPIFSMAIKLLSEGRYPQIVGNDIGRSLIKALTKLGDKTMPQKEAFEALKGYEEKRIRRAQNDGARGRIRDFCTCLRIFLRQGPKLQDAIHYAEWIMSATGPIKMMTGHKSKGLEFDNVFILDRELLRLDDDRGRNQDQNLLYVMQTRSMAMLTYITTAAFVPMEVETLEVEE